MTRNLCLTIFTPSGAHQDLLRICSSTKIFSRVASCTSTSTTPQVGREPQFLGRMAPGGRVWAGRVSFSCCTLSLSTFHSFLLSVLTFFTFIFLVWAGKLSLSKRIGWILCSFQSGQEAGTVGGKRLKVWRRWLSLCWAGSSHDQWSMFNVHFYFIFDMISRHN